MRISIHGSCVTRDIFHEVEKDSIIGWYRARASLHSLAREPLQEEIEVELSSNFQRGCVIDDLKKRPIDPSNVDFMIVDFIDERFEIVEFHNTFATNSNEFRESFPGDYPFIFKRGTREDYDHWESACEEFSKFSHDIPIILHRSKYARTSINRDTRNIEVIASHEFIDEMNNRLRRYEDIFCKYNDIVGFIDVDESLVVSDSSNRWGAAPYHYIPEYYEEAYRQFNEISSSSTRSVQKRGDMQGLTHEVVTYFGIGIYDRNWLHNRMDLFERTLLSSLKRQSTKNFTFNIYIDHRHPFFVSDRLKQLLGRCDFDSNICEVDSIKTAASHGGSCIHSDYENNSGFLVIISAIDDDDFIHTSAIETIQKVALSSGKYSLITLNHGLEMDIARNLSRHIKPDSIRLLISVASPPNKRIYSPSNYNHITIGDTLRKNVDLEIIRLEGRIWFAHVKHSLSDSSYYGARYKIWRDSASFSIPDCHQIAKSLGIESLDKIIRFGQDLPDGMPFKPLSRGYDSILSPQKSLKDRFRSTKLTRSSISFGSEKNVLIIGTDLTASCVKDALKNTGARIIHQNKIKWPFDYSEWNEINPDIIFLDLPTIKTFLPSDSQAFEDFIMTVFPICDQIHVHDIAENTKFPFEGDLAKNFERMVLPVEIIGVKTKIETQEEYANYLKFFRRMMSNRFEGIVNG
jgi:hypothetical protein